MHRALSRIGALLCLWGAAWGAPGRSVYKGMALTPYSETTERTFEHMVDEIAALGASHVTLVVTWAQRDVRAVHIGPHAKETPSDEVVVRIMRRARAQKLGVVIFPILWVESRAAGEWRGTLKPTDEAAWWRAYEAFVTHYARLAEAHGAVALSVGSEFASLEHREARWRELIHRVRQIFRGELLYSANWDHYQSVPFWDALDLVGLTAYYELSKSTTPTAVELVRAWNALRGPLVAWQREIGRPLVFTEVGYPSLDGAASKPWDYTGARPVDLDEQRLCYEAFATAWAAEPALGGVFFWHWWGAGGPEDGGYTVRGKPAEEVVRRFFRAGGP